MISEQNKMISFFKICRYSVVLGLTCFICCLPYFYRNYATDKVIGFTSAGGIDMYKGLLPHSEGSNYLYNGGNYYDELGRLDLEAGKLETPGAQNAFFMNKSVAVWQQHPLFALKMYALKLKNFWWFRTLAGNELSIKARRFVPWYQVVYFLLLVGMALSLLRWRGNMLLVLSPAIALSLLQACFYVETRHRILIEPLLIFAGTLGWLQWGERVGALFTLKK